MRYTKIKISNSIMGKKIKDLNVAPAIKTNLGNKSKRREVYHQARELGFKGLPYRNGVLTKSYCKYISGYLRDSTGYEGVAFRSGLTTGTFDKFMANINQFVPMSKAVDLLKKHRYMFRTEKARQRPLEVRFQSGVHGQICKPISCGKFYNLLGMLEKFQDGIQRNSKGEPVNVWDGQPEGFKYIRMRISFKKGGRDHCRRTTPKVKISNYQFNCIDPKSRNNNCGIKCLQELFKMPLNSGDERKALHIESNALLTPDQLNAIYDKHNPSENKHLEIIFDEQFDGEMDFETTDYLYLNKEHYVLVNSAERRTFKDKNTKRGWVYWDIETRPTDEYICIGRTKSYVLKDTITSFVYQPYKSKQHYTKTFVTDEIHSSVLKFKTWLAKQASLGQFYNCYAHNAANFDHYLFTQDFTQNDLTESNIQLRGTSIISLSYKSHLFKDSCCFLTNSLSKLCKGFLDKEEMKYAKIEEISMNGKILSNKELCFYQPDLSFWDFMQLQHKEPQFWAEYVRYCEYDCRSLKMVWEKFTEKMNTLIGNVGEYILRRCNATSCSTIGSLAKKILNSSNGVGKGLKPAWQYTIYQKFIGACKEKYHFVQNFKRGGISHCNQPGKHKEGICGVDIVSQYPAACVNMKIPVGESRWVESYLPEAHGFYHLKHLKFNASSQFKPVAPTLKHKDASLNWNSGDMDECFVDSYLIKYLQKHFQLKSFEVVKGLVSNQEMAGDKLFGKFVNTNFTEKRNQDKFKSSTDPEMKAKYNEALRTTIKLLLNAVTGKMVEDPSKYYRHVFGGEATGDKSLNGVNLKRVSSDSINPWLTAGVMIYSYSKRLLFEYIRMLPNNSDDVIHVETDGIYFPAPKQAEFEENLANYSGKYPCQYGKELGHLELEKVELGESYWLGKKFYYINDGTMRCRGIPAKTIDKWGKDIQLVDKQLFVDVFNGKAVVKEYATIQRHLWDGKRNSTVCLTSHRQSRTINPRMRYKTYFSAN
jgi:hypothetical protein